MGRRRAGADAPGRTASGDRGDDLTDADLLAILVREPFSGITPAVYASLSDWQILHVLFAERDDNFALIPLKRRYQRLLIKARVTPELYTQAPPDAGELNIPQEALALMPERMPGTFISMYWMRLKNLRFTDEQILERWKAFAAKGFN